MKPVWLKMKKIVNRLYASLVSKMKEKKKKKEKEKRKIIEDMLIDTFPKSVVKLRCDHF